MWNLLMGAGYSSEEEVEEEDQGQGVIQQAAKQVQPLPELHSKEAGKVTVTRVQLSPASRERGDGSEGPRPQDSTASAKSPARLIHLPETGIVLDKLPPIRDAQEAVLARCTPTSPLVPMQVGSAVKQTHPRPVKKEKEPKFVPYEPYKAAVTHLVDPVRQQPLPGRKSRSEDGTKRQLDKQTSIGDALTVDEHDVKQEIAAGRETREQLEQKDGEIARLKSELEEREKQLRIQTQVNSEVKRLLVASVGEDIEAKVDFLTQDKARLSADIRQYASKISRDFEEKEKLSVESNLWKSKFLACSVIVDELARGKAQLLHRCEATEHHLRLVLHEHSVLWRTLNDSYSLLAGLRGAFDPLSEPTRPAPPEAASFLGLADHALEVGRELSARLVGDSKLGETARKGRPAGPKMMDTPAEEGIKEVLSQPLTVSGGAEYSELASLAVTGAAKTHLRKMGDKLTEPTTGFKTCTHCMGSVQNI